MSKELPNDLGQSGPTQKYKNRFEIIFQADIEFSRRFNAQISRILDEIILPKQIDNLEGTERDRIQGHDFSVGLKYNSAGGRVRRFAFQDWDHFTQDDKEKNTMACDLYVHAYAMPLGDELHSYMVFDGHDFLKYRDTSKIPMVGRRRNEEHSLVWFSCYRNYDIVKNCRIYVRHGDIGWKSDKIFRGKCTICGETVMSINVDPPKGRLAHINCLPESAEH